MSDDSGVIAIVRLRRTRPPIELFEALVRGGVTRLEITLPTPSATQAIAAWADTVPGVQVGAGTVRSAVDVRRAVDAGARFLVTPTYLPAVLDAAHGSAVPVYCGAATPTECDAAWQHPAVAGVKVFPAAQLGGPAYVRALGDPLHDIPFFPTGGVDIENTRVYAAMGCGGVGVGGALVSEELVEARRFEAIAERAAAFVAAWETGRKESSQ